MRHWTTRYEAKHNYFKKLGQSIGNLSWTLAMRHQYLQCYYNIAADSIFDEKTEVGPGMSFFAKECILF